MAPVLPYPDGVTVNICPPGMALGCFELRSRGHGEDYAAITIWPKTHYRVFTGGPTKYRDIAFGRLTFQQEIYVYLRELGETIQDSFDALKTEVTEELQTCAYCQAKFGCERKKKYCTADCLRKAIAWGRIVKHMTAAVAEMKYALQDYKPKIFKHKRSWRIGALGDDGTYRMIGKRFNTFGDAAQVCAKYTESKQEVNA